MRALWSTLVGIYSRWRFVEDLEPVAGAAPSRRGPETADEEIMRLRRAIARERRNLASFQRFELGALAGPCESSIRAMEARIRALEMTVRRAV